MTRAVDDSRAFHDGFSAPPDASVGDEVVADDGALGRVDRVIRSETSAPMFLVVAAGRWVRRRYPVVPWSLVCSVDSSRRRVRVRGPRQRLGRLSETPPIVV